ncbi:MAG TPA: methylmalonyl-CoA mutase family protein, partial [Pyrinomonadaceae bacterium]|nr:methylmalonyl-CoA mutase family protein [Pyrinomonadaceae bacterium]
GGSYYVESLTQKMIDGCLDYFDKIDNFGGMVEAVEAGFPQREIQESAYQYQKAVERHEQIIVGVNKYAMDIELHKTDILQIDENVRDHQLERLHLTKTTRDNGAVANHLEKLKRAAKDNENLMPVTIEAVKAYATVEEICTALRDVYGIYEEPAF